MNKKKIILLVLLVVAIIILGTIGRVIYLQVAEANYSPDMTRQDKYLGIKNPASLMMKYEGQVELDTILENLEDIVEDDLPELAENVRGKEITKYFEANKDNLQKKFGITTVVQFETLVNKLNKIGNNIENYSTCEFTGDKMTNDGDYLKCVISIMYGDVGIEFNYEIAYTLNTKPLIVFY